MANTQTVTQKVLEELKKQQEIEKKEKKLNLLDRLAITYLNLKDRWSFSLKDKIFFLKELAYLLQWWVSIVEAITLIRDTTDNSVVRQICEKIYQHLKKWESFSRVLVRLPEYFNDWDVAVIRAWEESWELVKVLNYLWWQYEFLNETKKKYIWAMLYPILLFLLSIIAIIIILIYVMPGLLSIVEDFWANLPFTTRLLLGVSKFLQNNIWNILIVGFFILFGFSLILSIEEGQHWKDRVIFKLPIFGKLTKYYFLIKFLRYMKLLIYSGMPFVDVFISLKNIMWNRVYWEMLDEVISAIRKWDSPFTVMDFYPLILPKDVVTILKVWEKTASIWESVDNALALYEVEFNTKINSLSKLIEPILIVVVWWIVAWIALSIFWIIWAILDSVNSM